MQKPITKARLQNYYVVATNPGGWESLIVDVRARSREEARDVALAELAKGKHSDWDIEMVLESEAA